MKTHVREFLMILLFAIATVAAVAALGVILFAQTAQAHSVTISWADTSNPTAGTTYSVYRASGNCSTSSVFTKLASGLTVLTFTDSTPTLGTWCYEETATVNGLESQPSAMLTVAFLPAPPQNPVASAIK